MSRLRAAMANHVRGGLSVATWHANHLRSEAEHLNSAFSPAVRAEVGAELLALCDEAAQEAQRLEIRTFEAAIHSAFTRELHSVASVQAVIRDVNAALDQLEQRGLLTPAVVEQARQAKGRAARHRSERKLEQAAVAMAGGGDKRAFKLRMEAQVILAQDWEKAFPGEMAPGS